MDGRSQSSPSENSDKIEDEEDGCDKVVDKVEQYDDDFVGESEINPGEGQVEDEELDDVDAFVEEEYMLDVEIEDPSGKTTGLKGTKEVAPPAAHSGFSNVFGRKLSVWDASKFISKWKLSHMKGYQIGIYSQTEAHKNLLKDRELDCKASVPLPIVCMMEEETLRILEKMEKSYRSDFGANHQLTKDVRTRINVVKAQLAAKRHYVPPSTTGWQLFLQNWCPWLATLLNNETSNEPEEKTMKEMFEEEEERKKERETEFIESGRERDTFDRLSHDETKRESNRAPQPGWGQWLGSLLWRAPASTEEKAEERQTKSLLTEAEEHPPQAQWGQWLGSLFKRMPAHIEGKDREKRRLPQAEGEEDYKVPLQPIWSYQLMNVWNRSQMSEVTEADDSNIPHMKDTQEEEGQKSRAGWGQRLGALRGRWGNETKVSPASSQSQHV